MPERSKKRVLIGMSGGVDSSVTAALLKEQGYDVIGVMFTLWKDKSFIKAGGTPSLKIKCCSLESQRNAEKIADFLDIPFYTINYSDYFKKNIVDHYIDTFVKASTPNPCARCNMFIKFGLMLETMKEHNADFVATGHYCRKIKENGTYKILKGIDPKKDQTYFLYHLTQEKLKHILWPVGEYTKDQIYAKAKSLKLPITFGRESQDICFIPDKDPKDFLRRHAPKAALKPGPIITIDGTVLDSQHQGLPLYTLGQRKGIDIGGLEEALYVVELNRANNTLVVGPEEALQNSGLVADHINIISGKPFSKSTKLDIKVRYSTQTYPATVEVNDDTAHVTFKTPMRAITPGQIVSFYDGDELLGGGIIKHAIK